MIDLLWQILPIALGVISSPVAVLALLGIMLSANARRNAVAYSLGWIASVGILLTLWIWLLVVTGASPEGDSLLVAVLHALVGACCWAGAFATYRRAHSTFEQVAAAHTPDELVAATPQLPGVLRSAERYTAPRSFALGVGVFALNPMNVSLVAATAISLHGSRLETTERVWVAAGFLVAAALPVWLPTLLLLVRGARVEPSLQRLRSWVLRNNGFLSAGVLMVVGFQQLGDALDRLQP